MGKTKLLVNLVGFVEMATNNRVTNPMLRAVIRDYAKRQIQDRHWGHVSQGLWIEPNIVKHFLQLDK